MKNKFYNQIVITGSIAYDEIMDFPKSFADYFHPEKLHQINVSFVVNKLEKQLGGTGTNIAYNLSLLTDKRIKLLGGVGKDGNAFLQFFKRNQINVEGIFVDKNLYTACGKVITDKHDNQIWGFYYGACEKADNIDLKQFADSKSFVIISANHPKPFLSFQKKSIDLKADYLYDPGMALTWISKTDLCQGITNCRFLIGNDYEISQILKFADLKIIDLINKDIGIITTLGEKGVNYKDKNQDLTISGFKVKKTIDPTGAGDAWRGGFVAGLVNGLDIKNALKQANVLASFAVENYGTVNHKPTKKEIENRVKSL